MKPQYEITSEVRKKVRDKARGMGLVLDGPICKAIEADFETRLLDAVTDQWLMDRWTVAKAERFAAASQPEPASS